MTPVLDFVRSIAKPAPAFRAAPNLRDHARECASFSWAEATRRDLSGLPGGAGLSIAHEANARQRLGAAVDIFTMEGGAP